MIHIGIVGTSGHYMSAIEATSSVCDIKIVSYCAVFPDEDLSYLRDHCTDAVEFSSYKEMLQQPELDAVVVCTHFGHNNIIACEALRSGLGCYCEKPAFLSYSEEAQLADVLRYIPDNRYTNMYEMRTMPHFIAAKEYLDTGLLGEVTLVHSQKSYKLGTRPEFYHARASYGGIIPWVGCHAFDLVQWICGIALKPDFAYHNVPSTDTNSELEQAAVCLCRFGGGVASFSFDFLRPAQAPTHADDRLRIVGTNGILEIQAGQVHVIDNDGSRALALPSAQNPFLLFVEKLKNSKAKTLMPSVGECMQTAHLAIALRNIADQTALQQ